LLVAAWGVSVVVLLLQTLHKASRSHGTDLTAYLAAARALLAGQDPYAARGYFYYMYPLPLALLSAPLTLLPWKAAVVLWFIGSVLALVWAGRVCADLAATHLGLPDGLRLGALGALLWFLLFDPVQNNLLNGQINFLVLLLCLLFLRAMLRGRTVSAAIFLAAAVSIKITPALLLAFAAARRQWAVVTLSLAAVIVFCLSPLPLVGLELLSYYETYLRTIVLEGIAMRLGVPHGVAFSTVGLVSALLPHWAGLLWVRVLAVGLPLGTLVLLEIAALRERSSGRDVWVFCAYLLVILLTTPFSEVHHLAYLFPAASVLILLAVARADRPGRVAAGGLVAFWVVLWGGRLDRTGPFFFLAIALLLGLVAVTLLRRGDRAMLSA
jgi:hypothetical protein